MRRACSDESDLEATHPARPAACQTALSRAQTPCPLTLQAWTTSARFVPTPQEAQRCSSSTRHPCKEVHCIADWLSSCSLDARSIAVGHVNDVCAAAINGSGCMSRWSSRGACRDGASTSLALGLARAWKHSQGPQKQILSGDP